MANDVGERQAGRMPVQPERLARTIARRKALRAGKWVKVWQRMTPARQLTHGPADRQEKWVVQWEIFLRAFLPREVSESRSGD